MEDTSIRERELVLKGLQQLQSGQLQEALDTAIALISQGHLSQPTMDLLTLMHDQPTCQPAVEKLLSMAIERRPQAALPAYTFARLMRKRNALSRALELFEEAVRRRPAFDEAQDQLQELRLACGQLDLQPLVSVILPTTGHPDVATALRSVLAQQHPKLEVMVVADGPTANERLQAVVPELLADPRVQVFALPYNVGAGLWNGHRAYASMPALARGTFVAFLDQDNAWAPDHLSRLVQLVAIERLQWASSLRVVTDGDGRVIAPDDCENVQPWNSIYDTHMNDTSAYLVRTDIAVRAASPWFARYRDAVSPDLAFGRHLREHFPRTGSTGAYTLYYRLGRDDSLPERYFLTGNQTMYARHGSPPPWRRAPPPAPGSPMPGSPPTGCPPPSP